MNDDRRSLPSVSSLLENAGVRSMLDVTPRPVVVDAIRRAIELARQSPAAAPADDHAWVSAISHAIDATLRPSLRPVINGTGVVLHTNLGRAPLAQSAIDAVARVAAGFANVEYDIESGARGSRYTHCASLLRELTGAEDALVVNNCAAALVLVLNTLADRRDAILSRGELVEIGGSFRVPDIMAKSGARLVEVGTTNRTNVEDFRRAIGAETGIIVKVHRSNFAISGFVAEASSAELGALAAEHDLPFLHDLGSGLLIDLQAFGLAGEPTARDALCAGGPRAIITMSGDKLLGGPQAGLICGPREMLDRIRRNPLTRSYRVDKLTLAALEATLALYRDPARARREIPALAQLTVSIGELRARAESMCAAIDAQGASASKAVSIVDSEASVGGGAFPTARIPSVALAVSGDAALTERRLRAGDPPIIARIADDRVLVDLRTLFARDDAAVASAIAAIVQ